MSVYYPQFDVVRYDADGYRIPVASATIIAYNVTASSSLSSVSSDTNGIVAQGSFTATAGDVVEFSHATYPGTCRMVLTATQEAAYRHPDNDIAAFVIENLSTPINSSQADIYAEDPDNPDIAPWLFASGSAGSSVVVPYQTSVAKNLRFRPRAVDDKNRRVGRAGDEANYADLAVPAILTIPDTPTIPVIPLFSHFVDRFTVSTSAETKHLFTVTRGTLLLLNGDAITGEYTGIYAANANDKYIRLKFAGTTVFDSSNVELPINNKKWRIKFEITRVKNSVVRVGVDFIVFGYDAYANYTEITSLDLSGTSYDIILEIETPDAAGDATLKMAMGRLESMPDATPPEGFASSCWDYWEADSYSQSDASNITTSWVGKYAAKNATVSGTPTFEIAELNDASPAIRLGADSNDYFTMPSMSAFTAGHIFIVQKVNDVSPDAGHRMGNSGGSNFYPKVSDGQIYLDFGSNAIKSCGSPVVATTGWHVTEIWSKTNDWGLYQNGMKVFSTTTNTVDFSLAALIGYNGGSAYMKVDIFGIYVFSAKLNDTARSMMYAYISQKVGV